MRSYHLESPYDGADVYWRFVSKALGANSAVGEGLMGEMGGWSDGGREVTGEGCWGDGGRGCWVGEIGERWIFAVGGGWMKIRSPPRFFFAELGDFDCFSLPGSPEMDGRGEPYFLRSCSVELYLVASLSFSIVVSRSL